MKPNKKKQPTRSETPVVLPPRQIALGKLYRILMILGSIVGVVVVAALLTVYGPEFFRPKSKQWWSDKEREERTPVLNPETPPGPAPEGMAWIRGGEFYMGYLGPQGDENCAYIHMVNVDGFWMDKYEVTNEEFAKFVAATKYLTVAERAPDPAEFPGVPRDKLKPFSLTFRKPNAGEYVDLNDHQSWWEVKYGASWKHPEGPESTIQGREKHPVVHVCYDDAIAYCKWADKRLPTEAEWEFAARGGLDRKKYSWGDELTPDGKNMANIWQGNFPAENKKGDGFEGTAPVGSFPPNGYGLYDMAGNAWEWCADWYQPRYYEDSPERNPKGPETGWDPLEPNTPKRVQRGGSFLCAENYCVRYIAGARGKGEVTSGSSHIGFRCVRDAPRTTPGNTSDSLVEYAYWGAGGAAILVAVGLGIFWWRRRANPV